MKNIILFVFLMSTVVSCQKSESSNNEHSSAIPDAEKLEEQALSLTDRKKLANAKGKELNVFSLQELENSIVQKEQPYTIIYFWKLNDKKTPYFDNYKLAVNKFSASEAGFLTVNMDGVLQLKEATTIVRLESVATEGVVIKNEDSKKKIIFNEPYIGQFPAYFIYNKSENKGMWVENTEDSAALLVILQSLIL